MAAGMELSQLAAVPSPSSAILEEPLLLHHLPNYNHDFAGDQYCSFEQVPAASELSQLYMAALGDGGLPGGSGAPFSIAGVPQDRNMPATLPAEGGGGGRVDDRRLGTTRDGTGCRMGGRRLRTVPGDRIAFRTRTEVDVLNDGYKWRKYGKKSVKSNPNPRNYYRCSTEGCSVKKRVERDREDGSFVITTYDGMHNHLPPDGGVVHHPVPRVDVAAGRWDGYASSSSEWMDGSMIMAATSQLISETGTPQVAHSSC